MEWTCIQTDTQGFVVIVACVSSTSASGCNSCKTGCTTSANVFYDECTHVHLLSCQACAPEGCVSVPYPVWWGCVCVCACVLWEEKPACVCVCVCWLMALREDAQQQWSLQLVFLPPHKHALYCGVISHCPDKWVTICTGSKCVCMCSEIDWFYVCSSAESICVGNIRSKFMHEGVCAL